MSLRMELMSHNSGQVGGSVNGVPVMALAFVLVVCNLLDFLTK